MSTQQQQQTAEKSVQTQDLAGATTLLVTNNPMAHLHTENTATEVANTLVSMATGRQRGTTVKQLVNKISVFFSSINFFFYRVSSVFLQLNQLYPFYPLLIIRHLEVFLQQWL